MVSCARCWTRESRFMLPMTREWVAKAESDYDGACEALRSRKKSRRDRICFFSQQCAEKYLKARLTEAGIAFPRTHELSILLHLCLPIEPLWSAFDPALCLAMHCGWKAPDMARRLGVAYATVTAWWDKGVPKQSVRYWNQLNAIARQYKFDAGMLLDDYLWTRELVEESMACSGCSRAE